MGYEDLTNREVGWRNPGMMDHATNVRVREKIKKMIQKQTIGLVENKAYELNEKVVVYTGTNQDGDAIFLEHSYHNGEIMKKIEIPIKNITLEDNVNVLKMEGYSYIGYYYNRDSEFHNKEEFQKLLKQYQEAIL